MSTDTQQAQSEPMFLYISTVRLVVLSIVSAGLYEAYWIYKNWRYLKERYGLKIRPFWRGIFGVFYCHSLLERIHEDRDAREVKVPGFAARGLATGWVILTILANIMGRLGITASIIAAFIPSFLCLVPVQKYVNSVTEKGSPGQKVYGWSAGHVVCVVFGLLVWGSILISLTATR